MRNYLKKKQIIDGMEVSGDAAKSWALLGLAVVIVAMQLLASFSKKMSLDLGRG